MKIPQLSLTTFLDHHSLSNQSIETIAAIAKEYANSPEGMLVVSPDNRSRMEINERIQTELQPSHTSLIRELVWGRNPRTKMTIPG
jgi:hypothetical protein